MQLKRLVLLVVINFFFQSSSASTLVDATFNVPASKTFSTYTLKKISPKYTELDYDALMSARFYIRTKLNSSWPDDDFTIDENRKGLSYDESNFNKRVFFTYTVLNSSEDKVLGCIYIKPSSNKKFDASVFIWTRQDLPEQKLHNLLLGDIKIWLSNDWPFKNIDYSLN
ncbi:MAG: hypothetical protein DIZ80_11415 [endosymbiont of Galathealinum brachiosum]|uniref:Uncharacterized protein n=1 Tax=endosymbiont of Galathealinum brachiosum TaxID=2200906 RepID=A0A370DD79_9GAMM|nr:MAG: hypothetical protein DIZ80_11415 [endosymbiont of Galathealinum brachiosum]